MSRVVIGMRFIISRNIDDNRLRSRSVFHLFEIFYLFQSFYHTVRKYGCF